MSEPAKRAATELYSERSACLLSNQSSVEGRITIVAAIIDAEFEPLVRALQMIARRGCGQGRETGQECWRPEVQASDFGWCSSCIAHTALEKLTGAK